jgi:DNA-directed RNA polymerase specialized sigma24 family protein
VVASAVVRGNVEHKGATVDLRARDLERFVDDVRPRLLRALAGAVGARDAADATAEAIAYAFEHWDRVSMMANPAGYLFRVGQSSTRQRHAPVLPPPEDIGVPDIEPALVPALLALPETQRTAVWLVHACGWRYAEVAEAMGTSASMVGNHLSRGLDALRQRLGVGVGD